MIHQLFLSYKKSGFLVAFFILLMVTIDGHANATTNIEAILNKIESNPQLENHPIWAALLHLQNDTPQITSSSFLLTAEQLSKKAEMQQTLKFLYEGDPQRVCRFPARYLWLKKKLDLPELPLDQCKDIQEFVEYAPFDSLSVVFANESITQPASIMGHLFLKISGKKQEKIIDHAVSFYTPAATYNIPKLVWESMVTGKEGFFTLIPYTEETKKYLEVEQRNLWEYKIKTTPEIRELIRNHLFELKQTTLLYFFHHYNCATLLRNILSLTEQMPPNVNLWVTPKDVVKDIFYGELLIDSKVSVSDNWLIDTLYPYSEHTDTQKKYAFETAKNDFLYSKQIISTEIWHAQKQVFYESYNSKDKDLFISNNINPIFSPGDSQVRFSYQESSNNKSVLLSFLPISHRINDDQRSYFSETELKLLEATLKLSDFNKIKVENIDIYAMKSYNPHNEITKNVSSAFKLAYGRPTINDNFSQGLYFEGAIGHTKRLNSNIDFFYMLGAGAEKSSGFLSQEIGVITKYNAMKTIVTAKNIDPLFSYKKGTLDFQLKHSLFLQHGFTLDFDLVKAYTPNITWKSLTTSLTKTF